MVDQSLNPVLERFNSSIVSSLKSEVYENKVLALSDISFSTYTP